MPALLNAYGVTPLTAGYGWAPTSLSGLRFWWRADQTPALSTSAGGISTSSTVLDQSGNGWDGKGSKDGCRLVTNVTGGLPAILINDSDFGTIGGALQFKSASVMTGLTAAHLFVALKRASASPGEYHCGTFGNFTGDDAARVFYPWTDGRVYDNFGRSARIDFAKPSGLDSWHRLSVAASSSGGTYWKDNASIYSDAVACGSTWNSTTGPLVGASWHDGFFSPPTNTWLGGYVLEIFCYSRVLTSTERGLADQYLADRISGAWVAAGGAG